MSDTTGSPEPIGLPDDLLALLRGSSPCYVSTLAEDGTPHTTSVWVDTDGRHILVASREGEQEAQNAARNARVALAVGDPADPALVYRVGGRVHHITARGATERRRELARRYLGPSSQVVPGDDRGDLVLVIVPHRVGRAA